MLLTSTYTGAQHLEPIQDLTCFGNPTYPQSSGLHIEPQMLFDSCLAPNLDHLF